MSKDVKEENVTLVNATATSQEARELTEHELNTVSGGLWGLAAMVAGGLISGHGLFGPSPIPTPQEPTV